MDKHRSITVISRPVKRDGEVARNLLNKYVDEVLAKNERPVYAHVDVPIDDDFDSQLKSLEDSSVPLISQTARKKAIWPVHTSEQRKRCIDICRRVKRNEGTMISCRLSSELMDDELVTRLCVSLRENTCLQRLMLHDNSITDKAIQPLCKALRMHPSLNTLWLGANELSDQSTEYLCTLIENNNTIKDLNLSNHWPPRRWLDTEKLDHPHVTSLGAERFASVLATCCGLTSLSLHDQRVRDAGAKALFAAIPQSNLVMINLGKNEITDDACNQISSCLSSHYCPLRELFLDNNTIGNKGAVLISHGLCSNSGLFTLDLNSNNIDEQGIEALYETLCINETLEALMVRNNEYSGDVIESLLAERKLEREKSLRELQNQYTPSSRQSRSRSRSSSSPNRTHLSKWRKARDPKQLEKIKHNNSRFNQVSSEFAGRMLSPSSWSKYRNSQHSPQKLAGLTTGLSSTVRSVMDSAGSTGSTGGIDSGMGRHTPADHFPSPARGGGPGESRGMAFTPVRSSLPSTAESSSLLGASGAFMGSPGKPRQRENSSPSSVSSRESQAEIITRGKSRENLTAGGDPSKQSRMDIILSGNKADATRTSDEIGRTLGVPNLKGLLGRAPIRSAISRHADSGINLIHLRVTTPADPPNSAAISLIKIDIDRNNERDRVKEEHQTEEYKEEKYLTMFYGNKKKMMAKTRFMPPDKFWGEWKEKVRVMHPKGIDISVLNKHETKKKHSDVMETELEHANTKTSPKKSPSMIRGSASTDADIPYGSCMGSPEEALRKKKKELSSRANVSNTEKSMLELLAVEHVFRKNKDTINPADAAYLRSRAIAPVHEHLSPILKKNSSGSPGRYANSGYGLSPKSKGSPTGGISYPAMVGLDLHNHYGVGEAVADKRKLTSYA